VGFWVFAPGWAGFERWLVGHVWRRVELGCLFVCCELVCHHLADVCRCRVDVFCCGVSLFIASLLPYMDSFFFYDRDHLLLMVRSDSTVLVSVVLVCLVLVCLG